MGVLNKKVLKDITQRKVRAALTILGIALGVFCLSAISIASNEFKSSFAYSTNQASQQDLQLYTEPTSPDLANTLAQQPNVKAVQAQGYIVTNWSIGDKDLQMKVVGLLDFQHVLMNKFQLVEGSLPGPGQIVLESSDQALDSVKLGDPITIQAGSSFRQLTVSGFVRTEGLPSASLSNQGLSYMPESSFENLFQRHGVTDFLIQLNNYDQLEQSARQLSGVIEQQHIAIDGTDIGRDTSVSDLANGVFAIMDALAVIAILLSSLLLLGTVSALIREQTRHIGTLKAIGATRGKIMRHYLSLVALYSLIGTVIGLALGILGGYALARYLGSLVTMDIGGLQITPLLLVVGLLVGMGVPLLAVLLPVYLGTRVTVQQALSGYGVENTSTKRGAGARLGRVILGGFPQTMQFGARGLFRKPVRTTLTLITLVAAGASFLAVSTAGYAFNTFLNHITDTYHFNVLVSFSDPQQVSAFQNSVISVNGISRIEELEQDAVTTQWGNASLSGVQVNTQLYQHTMLAGRWFTANDQNVVILSKDAADTSGLHVGDMISFSTPVQSASWKIIGIVSDYSGIGAGNLGTLVAPVGQVTRFMQEPAGSVSEFMVQSTNTSQSAVDTLSDGIDNTLIAQGFLPNVITAQQQVQENQDKYQTIYTLLDAVAIIIALVGMINLSNTLVMNILERRREIGILRSMGAVSRKVAQVFWTEGLMFGLLSWIFAVIVGIPLSYALVQVQAHVLAPVPFAFDPLSPLTMLLLIIPATVLACIGPIMAASRMKIAQTLRYE